MASSRPTQQRSRNEARKTSSAILPQRPQNHLTSATLVNDRPRRNVKPTQKVKSSSATLRLSATTLNQQERAQLKRQEKSLPQSKAPTAVSQASLNVIDSN